MAGGQDTRDALIEEGRRLFAERGYRATGVRDIAAAVGVDAALVSRYFGSKRGLFEAALDGVVSADYFMATPPDEAAGAIAQALGHKKRRSADTLDPMRMVILNVMDEEVGDLVRARLHKDLLRPLQKYLGGADAKEKAALMMAVLVGADLMRNQVRAPGIADQTGAAYAAQLERLLRVALDQEG